MSGTFCVVWWQEKWRSMSPQRRPCTRTACECAAHVVQALTDLNPEATVVSIDGIGACDLISKTAMWNVFLQMEYGDEALPLPFWLKFNSFLFKQVVTQFSRPAWSLIWCLFPCLPASRQFVSQALGLIAVGQRLASE